MQEQTIFDLLFPKFKIDKLIRLIELFAGIGSQATALKRLGVPFEHWRISEWSIKSIIAYKNLHFPNEEYDYSKGHTKEQLIEILFKAGISNNWNDAMTKEQITKMNESKLREIYNAMISTHNLGNIQNISAERLGIEKTNEYIYIMTYSFPCQDLSLAGKGKGMSDTSTRSGMLWEVERLLSETKEKPQVLIMENVVDIHNERNKDDFKKWILRLEELGYSNYYQDLIATDYGIPQTRNRCFMVSILGEYSYSFPPKQKLDLKLKDMLDDYVNKKYFLSDKAINGLIRQTEKEHKPKFINAQKEDDVPFSTITCGYRKQGHYETYLVDEKYYLTEKMKEYITSNDHNYKVNPNKLVINRDIAVAKTTREGCTRADASDYICYDLPTNSNYLKIKNATKKGYIEATDGDGIDISGRMEHHRGTVQKGKAQTLNTYGGENVGVLVKDLKIRKLSPRECGRLMGFNDEEITLLSKGQSDSTLYHLFGDSIVVNVIEAVMKELF